MTKSAFVMLVYAVLLFSMGILSYMVAPVGASALTALAVPGLAGVLMLVCFFLSMLEGTPRRVGDIGGILLPVLFAIAVVGRAAPATGAYMDAKATLAAAMEDSDSATPDVLSEREREALRKDYLVMSLWGLAALSALAFISLLMLGVRRVASGEAVEVEVHKVRETPPVETRRPAAAAPPMAEPRRSNEPSLPNDPGRPNEPLDAPGPDESRDTRETDERSL